MRLVVPPVVAVTVPMGGMPRSRAGLEMWQQTVAQVVMAETPLAEPPAMVAMGGLAAQVARARRVPASHSTETAGPPRVLVESVETVGMQPAESLEMAALAVMAVMAAPVGQDSVRQPRG